MSKIPTICMIPSGYKAGKVYSVLPTNGDADLTFTRASEATRVDETGVIETMATGVPRLDYSDSGCPSLLVEPQSTNLLTYSEDFSDASYVKDALTITSNAINSPNNSLTADLLLPTASNTSHYLYKTTTVTSATVYTFSVFVKKAGYNFIQLSFVNGTVTGGNPIFDLNLGTVISGNGIITSLPNGWYKISATVTTTTTSLLSLISVRQSSGISAFIGDTISGVYAWGAQLEALPYATSYIPTVASTVTRVAETVSKTGLSSYINSQDGVLFVEMVALADTTISRDISINDGSNNNFIRIGYTFISNQIRITALSSTVQIFNYYATVTNILNYTKIAVKWGSGVYKVYVNGNEVYSFNSLTTPLNLSVLQNSINNTNPFHGKLKDLRVYDKALSDAELIALTSN